MAVTPNWTRVVNALHEWIAEDVKDTPKRIFLLAKFLFGVSVGSTGLLISIYKFIDQDWGAFTPVSLVALLFSAAIALYLAIPTVIDLKATPDLVREHNRIIDRARKLVVSWGIAWLVAVALFAASMFCAPDNNRTPTNSADTSPADRHQGANPGPSSPPADSPT